MSMVIFSFGIRFKSLPVCVYLFVYVLGGVQLKLYVDLYMHYALVKCTLDRKSLVKIYSQIILSICRLHS